MLFTCAAAAAAAAVLSYLKLQPVVLLCTLHLPTISYRASTLIKVITPTTQIRGNLALISACWAMIAVALIGLTSP